jgi:IclR family pca regulon transcriptional regulator
MLLTLIELGLVAETQRHYQLTARVLRLGYSFLSQTGLDGIAQPFVTEVAQRTGESCSVAILDETDVVSVVHTPSPTHKIGFTLRPGTRWPAYVMASAFTSRTLVKIEAILDAVRKARQQGYALVKGELEEGLMSVAVPIRNRNGDVIASLNSSSSATRATARSFCDAVVPLLHSATGEMAKIL